jgi:WD40 repeat protein
MYGQELRLQGDTDYIFCLIFRKKFNWFASGSCDHTIRYWKEQENLD